MTFFVIVFALLFSALNSISFFSGFLHEKSGEVYLGTIHYYEDYFFYLSQFFQGAHGAWLTANRYTSELTEPSFLFWPNVLLGKIGGMLGLSPILSYNISVFLLSFFILVLMYFIFRKIFSYSPSQSALAFLFAATGTSLMNHILVGGKPIWYPFELWKTPDFALNRLGGVPHQLVQTVLFLLLMFFWFTKNKKRPVISVFLIILLTSVNPVMSALFLCAAWVTWILNKILTIGRRGAASHFEVPSWPWQKNSDGKDKTMDLDGTSKRRAAISARWFSWATSASFVTSGSATREFLLLLFASIGFAITFFVYDSLINTQPHVQSKLWEAAQQIHTTPLFLLLSIGPLSFLAILGFVPIVKRRRAVDIFAVTLLIICYGLIFTPIPVKAGISSSRILFPALYVFWGALALEGVIYASSIVYHVSRKKLSLNASRLTLITLFLFATIPTLQWEINGKLLVKREERIPLLYLPTEVYGGFQKLSSLGSYDDVVIASPLSHMDAMVPALTGHTGFTGHPFATFQSTQKRELATRFFLHQMNASEAQQFLMNNHIKYVFFSKFDGDTTQFQNAYPFLKEVYTTPGATIFLTPQ